MPLASNGGGGAGGGLLLLADPASVAPVREDPERCHQISDELPQVPPRSLFNDPEWFFRKLPDYTGDR